MSIRIGQGFDAHRFVKGRPLILGGIQVPYEFGLEGHSDADVLTHAAIDAILGALSLGDIGKWFPDDDSCYKNACSIELLERVLQSDELKNSSLINLDATIIAQKPKLSEHTCSMQKVFSKAFNASVKQISIKAKTTEGMGFCGREEGIAALVNVLLKTDVV